MSVRGIRCHRLGKSTRQSGEAITSENAMPSPRRISLTLVGIFATATAALAVAASADTQTPPAAQDFATAKTQILARLNEELACVHSSTTLEELQACRPKPPSGHPPGPPPQSK